MSIKLYGMMFSPTVRSVLLTANLVNCKVDFKKVNIFKAEHHKPDYLKLNPLHTIPTIDDNGFILFDSNAIVTYLVDKYAKDDSLYPKDLQTRAIVNQRLFFGILYFTALKDWSVPFLRPGDPDIIKRDSLAIIQGHLNNFGALRGDNTWIAGTKSPTVADICLLCHTESAELFMEHEVASRPKVHSWLKEMRAWAEANIPNYPNISEEGRNSLMRFGIEPAQKQ